MTLTGNYKYSSLKCLTKCDGFHVLTYIQCTLSIHSFSFFLSLCLSLSLSLFLSCPLSLFTSVFPSCNAQPSGVAVPPSCIGVAVYSYEGFRAVYEPWNCEWIDRKHLPLAFLS